MAAADGRARMAEGLRCLRKALSARWISEVMRWTQVSFH
jgi:hypothetical protein